MQFIRDRKLARRLRAGEVSEKEQFHYLLAMVLFTLLIITSGLIEASVSLTIYDYLSVLVFFCTSILTLIICYLTNKRGDNSSFVMRFISLFVPVNIQVILLSFPLFILAYFLDNPEILEVFTSDDLEASFEVQTGPITFISYILFYLYYLWRMNSSFKIAAGLTETNSCISVTRFSRMETSTDQNIATEEHTQNSNGTSQDEPLSGNLLKRVFYNFLYGARLALFLPMATKRKFDISWHALWAAALFYTAINFGIDYLDVTEPREFYYDAITGDFFKTAIILLAVYLISLLYFKTDYVLKISTILLCALIIPYTTSRVIYLLSPDWLADEEKRDLFSYCWYFWIYLICFRAIMDVYDWPYLKTQQFRHMLRDILAPVFIVVAIYLPLRYLYYDSYWYPDYSATPETALDQISVENLFTSQGALIAKQASLIKESDEGTTDIFGVVLGSYGYQEIFRREVSYVKKSLEQYYGMNERVIELINNQETVLEKPLAMASNLDISLKALSSRMQEEDILLLYMTSHGDADIGLSVNLGNRISFEQINAARVRKALDDSGIKNRIIFISACYSGSMIDGLADENTLIMTASAADKTSFGCSDKYEMTYFAEAIFKQALPIETNLIKAFDIAKVKIKDKEIAENVCGHSYPQIFIGDNIVESLNAYAYGTPYIETGITYAEAALTEKPEVKAIYEAAKDGDATAQVQLADMYANGDVLAQNYTSAALWYRKAAEQENPLAQYYLGAYYYYGEGVEQNYQTAAMWIQKSATQGNPDAQLFLGNLYLDGIGVTTSYEVAADWVEKAAMQNHPWAQYELGYKYRYGIGIDLDLEKAYVWSSIAAENESGDEEIIQNAIDQRDEAQELMTEKNMKNAKIALKKLSRELAEYDKK